MKLAITPLLTISAILFSGSAIASPKDPFEKWYKKDAAIIETPSSYDDSAAELVSLIRKLFLQQVSNVPEEEWQSTRKLAGDLSNSARHEVLKATLSANNDNGNNPNLPDVNGKSPTFRHGADATAYRLAACGWHYYYLSMQTNDDGLRKYTQANTKILLAAASALVNIAPEYDADKKFNPQANNQAIWQGMNDTQTIIYKMAEVASKDDETEYNKYKDTFDAGTKSCQENSTDLASIILLKAFNK